MMKSRNLIIIGLLLVTSLVSHAQDIANSSDHSIISRYPDSKIISYYERDYNEIKFATDAAKAENPASEFLNVQGKHTSIVYELPTGKTTVEAMRNYKDAILEKGGTIVFECSSGECDGTDAWYNAKFFNSIYMGNDRSGGGVSHYEHFDDYHQAQKYLVAKITTTNKIYFLEIGMTPKYDDNPVKIIIEVVEQNNMETGLIEVNADIIKEEMDKNGKVELYGIFFDTGKSTIKENSAKELNEVIIYLNNNKQVNIYVVGHTDDTGSVNINLQLSEDRANSVREYLIDKGISEARIESYGVASFAPVSTNENEEGRQLNRRVEIVKRLK